MTIKKKLKTLVAAILEEAEKNPEFAEKLSVTLGIEKPDGQGTETVKKRGGRRAPAVLDPVVVINEEAGQLRERLTALDIEQLRDIVAEYGMDPGKLVMKWKTKERVIDYIVEVASTRAKKGEAFR